MKANLDITNLVIARSKFSCQSLGPSLYDFYVMVILNIFRAFLILCLANISLKVIWLKFNFYQLSYGS